MTMTEPVVLINAFEVPADQAGQFIAAWEATRDFLQSQPGYIETALHQALTPNADFLFVNIARWQTAEAFSAALGSAGFRESAAGLASYGNHPALYRIVRT
jgi:heme-degrading monooxygenase HmoA